MVYYARRDEDITKEFGFAEESRRLMLHDLIRLTNLRSLGFVCGAISLIGVTMFLTELCIYNLQRLSRYVTGFYCGLFSKKKCKPIVIMVSTSK